MKFKSALETEVKIRIPNISSTRDLLESLGFSKEIEMQEETSTLWDCDGALRAQHCALRLRIYAGKIFLTYKGARLSDNEFKIRPESEVTVSDLGQMESILKHLGYRPALTMVKHREVWCRPELIACVDETPLGLFLEIEGVAPAIKLAMETLCRDPDRIEIRDYPSMYEEYAAPHGKMI